MPRQSRRRTQCTVRSDRAPRKGSSGRVARLLDETGRCRRSPSRVNATARGRVDLAKIRAQWDDMLRVAVSVHTGAVSAYDVIRVLHHGGCPTPPGEAITHNGRI